MGFALAAVAGVTAGTALGQTQIATTATLFVTSGGRAVTTVASGSVVTLTATVNAGGIPVTPGQVNFCDASAAFCTDIHLLGTAQLTSSGTAMMKVRPGLGTHSYKAVFLGTNSDLGSSSGASALAVTGTLYPLGSSTTIAETGSWGNYALTATVTEYGGTAAPTGSVSFLDTSERSSALANANLGSPVAGIHWPTPLGLSLPTNSPSAAAVGDFNGDGIPDLVVNAGGPSQPLVIFLGNANGTYTSIAGPSIFTYSFGPIVVADFNGDGKLDMAVLNANSSVVTILLGNGDGTFTIAGSSPASGSGPNQLALGDFNRDGIPDLAVTDTSTNSVNILLGKGDGTFTVTASPPTVGSSPYAIAVGDFNGDGKLDLAVTDTYDDAISIVLGNGDGTFAAATTLHSGSKGSPIVAADFTGDGKLDLAVGVAGTGGASDSTTVLSGNGDGIFSTPQAGTAASANSISAIHVGDFNADGIIDLVLTDSNAGTFTVFLGNGTGSFTANTVSLPGSPTFGLTSAVGDINGDGRTDLLVGVYGGGSALVYLTEAMETATATANVAPASVGAHLVDASYGGDSDYNSSTSATIPLWGQLPATSTTMTVTSGGSPVTSVTPGTAVTLTATILAGTTPITSGQVKFCDASATECTDIHVLATTEITSAGTAAYKFVPGPGTYSYRAELVEGGFGLASVSAASSLTVGPAPSVVYSDNTAITASGSPGDYTLTATVVGFGGPAAPTGNILFMDTSFGNTSLGTAPLGPATAGLGFLTSQAPALSGAPTSEVTGDFNGDGIPDLAFIWSSSSYGGPYSVTIFFGKGDGTFTAGPTVSPAGVHSYPVLLAGDFNGDGKTDLTVLSYDGSTTSYITTLLGKGDGTFGTPQTGTAYDQGVTGGDVILGSFIAADFNGDGKLDLAVVGDYVGSGGIIILLGNGDGTFQAGTPNFAITQGFNVVATGDFNGDGVPDIVAANYFYPGGATVLLGNGDGTFTAMAATLPTDTFTRSIVVGDFNGDGKLDLAFGNNGANAVFLGNGDGTFNQAPGSPVAGGGVSLVAGDFNHDGKLDLAGLDTYGGQVDLFLGNGDGTFTETTATPTLGQSPLALYAAIVPADFNRDGVTDLAFATAYQDTASILITEPTQTAQASVTGIAPVGVGTHNVEASYPGDSNYPSSVSGTAALTAGLTPLVFSPTPGSYSAPQTITITESIPGSTIYYSATGPVSTNGFVPYTGPLQITTAGVESIQTYATETGYQQTNYVSPVNFTINLPVAATPVFSPTPGTYTSSQSVTISDTTAGATIYYTTDGSQPTSASAVYSAPVIVSSTERVKAITVATGFTDSQVAAAAYTINSSAVPSITWAAPAPIAYGTPLGSAQLNAATTVAGSFVYSPPAGKVLTVGQQTLKTTFTPSDTTTYTTATASVPLMVTLATPALSELGSSMNPSFASSPVTFTVSVTATVGTPTGSVAFFDGSTQLGSAALSTGSASFTTSALASGSHPITAVYSGDTNFATLTSAVLTETVESYTIGTPSGGASSATISPGGQANFVLAVSPPTVGASLTFTVTGLPAGSTAMFSPSTVPAGSAATNVTLTVNLPNTAEVRPVKSPFRHDDLPVLLGLFLLPFTGKLRRKAQRWRGLFLLGMVGAMMAAGVSGCGSSGAGSGNGSTPTPHVYPLTVTAASGSLAQSATVTLTVD